MHVLRQRSVFDTCRPSVYCTPFARQYSCTSLVPDGVSAGAVSKFVYVVDMHAGILLAQLCLVTAKAAVPACSHGHLRAGAILSYQLTPKCDSKGLQGSSHYSICNAHELADISRIILHCKQLYRCACGCIADMRQCMPARHSRVQVYPLTSPRFEDDTISTMLKCVIDAFRRLYGVLPAEPYSSRPLAFCRDAAILPRSRRSSKASSIA